MRFLLGLVGLLGLIGLFPETAFAYAPLTLRYQHHLFTLDPDNYPDWRGQEEVWMLHGKEIPAPTEFRVDGDVLPKTPTGLERRSGINWNREAIRQTLERKIGKVFNREPGSVRISASGSGVTFEGVGLPGRSLQSTIAADLIVAALKEGVIDVTLPVTETQPSITVEDKELRDLGIRDVVTVGESDFTGSPENRRHNIGVGLSKFNGHLIPRGTTFSFNEVLGPVNGATGYRKELVIKGDKTEPDYGGGLCQVSTTAYRGIWEYGFPILVRRNHSYTVSYYGPQGSDATVWPGSQDMVFRNDGPSALLLQTHREGNKAYFIYYGTRDARIADVIGPYTWGYSNPPPDRTEYTTEIPPGSKRKVGDKHAGMHALWFRIVKHESGGETIEPVHSIYEARPLFMQVGVEPGQLPPEENTENIPVVPEPDRLAPGS